MDLSLLNAYELYRSNTDHPVSRYDFMCDVVLGLCASGEAAAVPDLQHCLQHLAGKRERECVVRSDRAQSIRRRSSFCCAACGDVLPPHAGQNGAPFKHQGAVAHHFKISGYNMLPFHSADLRCLYYRIAIH